MIERAFEWAKANKRLRTNPVHGEEEVRIVLNDTFELQDVTTEETTQSGAFTMEAVYMVCKLSLIHI